MFCQQTYAPVCHYFVYDKKNCHCKLYEVNSQSLLNEYNDGCNRLGGKKYPNLATCPGFVNDIETCYVS